MDKKPQRPRLAAKALVTVLGFDIALAGCATADGDYITPPLDTTPPAAATATATAAPTPAETAQAEVVPPTEQPTAADLWSDDRSRIDTPLLDIGLDAETQWAIFEQVCGQDTSAFCALMAIAYRESHFTPDLVGDDGKSFGMMQINTKWHTGRMEALGVTDLADPVQCAAVALDYLQELSTRYGFGWVEDHAIYMAYNMGPGGASNALAAGRTSTSYSEAVLKVYHSYMNEMEWAR